MWATSLVLVAISFATVRAGGPNDPGTALLEGGAGLMLITVGAILEGRLPHHLVGWLLASGGVVLAVVFEHYDMPDSGQDAKGIMRRNGLVVAWFKDPAGTSCPFCSSGSHSPVAATLRDGPAAIGGSERLNLT
jgi:hypothetical protein